MKILKKEYLPNSKAYKLHYEGGGIGYGSDPSILKDYVEKAKKYPQEDIIEQQIKILKGNDSPTPENASEEYKLFRDNQFEGIGVESHGGVPVLMDEQSNYLENGDLENPPDDKMAKLIELMIGG